MRLGAMVWIWTLAATPAAAGQDAAYPEYDDPQLERGRAVWRATCRECHANPLSDAPQIKDKAAWTARLDQGVTFCMPMR